MLKGQPDEFKFFITEDGLRILPACFFALILRLTQTKSPFCLWYIQITHADTIFPLYPRSYIFVTCFLLLKILFGIKVIRINRDTEHVAKHRKFNTWNGVRIPSGRWIWARSGRTFCEQIMSNFSKPYHPHRAVISIPVEEEELIWRINKYYITPI